MFDEGDSILVYGKWPTHNQSLKDGFIKGFCTHKLERPKGFIINSYWGTDGRKAVNSRLVLTETTLNIFNGL